MLKVFILPLVCLLFPVRRKVQHRQHGEGVHRVLQRIVLLTDTLEPTKPLRVPHVPVIGQEDAEAPEYTDRRHDQLTDTGRQRREAFNEALAKRFLPRYKTSLFTRTHPFDHAIVLSPKMRQLKHIDVLLSAGTAAGLPRASDEN